MEDFTKQKPVSLAGGMFWVLGAATALGVFFNSLNPNGTQFREDQPDQADEAISSHHKPVPSMSGTNGGAVNVVNKTNGAAK